MRFTGAGFRFPTCADVDGEFRGDFPIVLKIGAHVMLEGAEGFHFFVCICAEAEQETGQAEALFGACGADLVV